MEYLWYIAVGDQKVQNLNMWELFLSLNWWSWQKMDKAKPNTKLKQILHWLFTWGAFTLHLQALSNWNWFIGPNYFYFHKNDHLKYVLAIYNCCNLLSYLYLFFCAYWLETWWVNLKDKNHNISSLPFKETWHNGSLYFYRMGKDLCKNSSYLWTV
jgi:hypothetical protein